MVNRKVVLETIKKMYDSGVEDEIVEQTLRDIGIGNSEIKQYIAEVKQGSMPAAEAAETGPFPSQAPAEPAPAPGQEAIKKQLDENHGEQQAMHETTHTALESQAAHVDEVKEKLAVCEAKLTALSSKAESGEGNAALNRRMAALEKEISDLKALTKALQTLMEKILETDRKVLNRL